MGPSVRDKDAREKAASHVPPVEARLAWSWAVAREPAPCRTQPGSRTANEARPAPDRAPAVRRVRLLRKHHAVDHVDDAVRLADIVGRDVRGLAHLVPE